MQQTTETATTALLTKYRPASFDEVVGQDEAVRSLSAVLEGGTAKSFLFSGPSGVGKTTLARLAARRLGCKRMNLVEVDAATFTGVDDMRRLTELSKYGGLGVSSTRVFIVDEAHRLSAAAWASLLKTVEEPAPHARWMFCTTDVAKVPVTIRTRCVHYSLKPLDSDALFGLVRGVAKAEGVRLPDDILDLVVEEARGSPRQALANLAACAVVKSRGEAAVILASAAESPDVVTLCRYLVGRDRLTWRRAAGMLKALADQDGEGVRRVMQAYMISVALGADSGRAAFRALRVLEELAAPVHAGDRLGPVILAVGKIVLADELRSKP